MKSDTTLLSRPICYPRAMNERVKLLFEAAQSLAPAEREELAELLLATIDVDPGFDEAWLREAQRRWDEHKASGGEAGGAFEAVDEARRKLKRSG